MRAFDIVKWWIEIPNDLSASRSKSTSNWRRANTTWNDNPAVNINLKEELFVSLIFTIMFVWNVHSICTISTHFSFHKNFMRILLFYWFYLRIYFCSKYLVFENLIFIDMTAKKNRLICVPTIKRTLSPCACCDFYFNCIWWRKQILFKRWRQYRIHLIQRWCEFELFYEMLAFNITLLYWVIPTLFQRFRKKKSQKEITEIYPEIFMTSKFWIWKMLLFGNKSVVSYRWNRENLILALNAQEFDHPQCKGVR